ncbi:FAD-dependent 5-carboxymethylaminomethyl-2-thiouridine(34) oxidoreductase MnmC [Shewanella litorisediminis]|uniref:FAD-dependent 5-carboxymethylaminomethyl-2-thiouridine(34) oxidoreductase MnmC n=1 Tax=Shewanella litorisediminis TaxID=1173586 RepID=A0ABX7FZH6_9GAMM|nr:FAD-dependent 5-carboxymethylaminomethyl-2-thiouridine(34) oxidoreductase MnmC [Shewanella litorisediminis]MCL2919530.1 FAD-dependent 5-carboxymethylaminomethyl-2-thiouridine(34) oxidoreductase MnmC [Shewanella litorisediminis]QRH00434.1 FAD-dependent 5-carboxymethylaminomethyl-2-thiouridine(34) oxidoreductase MnmC [Shewanella litorisediminis]
MPEFFAIDMALPSSLPLPEGPCVVLFEALPEPLLWQWLLAAVRTSQPNTGNQSNASKTSIQHTAKKPLQIIILLKNEPELQALAHDPAHPLATFAMAASHIKGGQRFHIDDNTWLDFYLCQQDVSAALAALPSASVDVLINPQGPFERAALRLVHQHSILIGDTEPSFSTAPSAKAPFKPRDISILGAGVAGASLALSLLRRGHRVTLYCADSAPGMGASGNRQGAIYPLLTPEDDHLTRLFVPAFLYAKRFVESLAHHPLPFDFCGVLQTGHDERAAERIEKLLGKTWPQEVAVRVDAARANHIAGLAIDKGGIYYPHGGWVSPAKLCEAAIAEAKKLGLECHFDVNITAIERTDERWRLHTQAGDIDARELVLATGHRVTELTQTQALQLAPFRGQVSHVPTQGKLGELKTVLCAHGYFTPGDESSGSHCMGASYVRGDTSAEYREQEQQENLHKMQESYPGKDWVNDLDISGQSARAGVRMVSRDHLPMAGAAPDVAEIQRQYLAVGHGPKGARYWQSHDAPVHPGLYIFSGLGSRGLSSGPLIAECLADSLSGTVPVLDSSVMEALNPNRMWLRKLKKGKALD